MKLKSSNNNSDKITKHKEGNCCYPTLYSWTTRHGYFDFVIDGDTYWMTLSKKEMKDLYNNLKQFFEASPL